LLRLFLWCRGAECGNGVCEAGEECSDALRSRCCAVDCPVIRKACPGGTAVSGGSGNSSTSLAQASCSGHGMCLSASGTCRCMGGYSGDDCRGCAAGYLRLMAGGSCVFLPGALSTCTDGMRSAAEAGVDCGGACDAPCHPGYSAAWTARYRVGIFASSAAVALACLIVAVVLMHRAHRRLSRTDSDNAEASTDRKYASASRSRRVSNRARGRAKSVPVVPWVGGTAATPGVDSVDPGAPACDSTVCGSDTGDPRRVDHPKPGGDTRSRFTCATGASGPVGGKRGRDDWLATATPISPLSTVSADTSVGGRRRQREAGGSGERSPAARPARPFVDQSSASAAASEAVAGGGGGHRASFDARAGGRTRVSLSSAVRPDPHSVTDFGL
jgi:hypothetical protein